MSSLMRKLHLLRTGKREDLLDISQITENLFISDWPAGKHAPEIAEQGITLIISMIREKQDSELTQPPFQNLQLHTTDFVLMPMSTDKLRRGVEAALPVIEAGGKVLTYCKSGIHRSAAMATCILIGQGYTVDEAIDLVQERRAAAKPDTPHIRKQIKKFAAEWQA
ncbi:MAG: dual specificity protein phosphatase family protein [Anaerolineaceae bacterium]|nr:MAG: dual specificity protein phosphatase family protein [Anaerolineaceae bacterium]